MTSEPWYQAADETARPGDVVCFPPWFHALRRPVVVLSPSRTQQKGRTSAQLLGLGDDHEVPKKVANGKSNAAFVVRGRFIAHGLLLTRGCEIDTGDKRQIAPIFPLSAVQGDGQRTAEQNQAAVVEGECLSQHYLPPVPAALGEWFGDSYVDFRYIMTLRRGLFETLRRSLSLTRPAVYDLYFSWLRHTTGHLVDTEGDCPKCGSRVPLLTDAPEVLFPPDDY